MVRVVELEGFQAGSRQVIQSQALIGLGHHGQAIADGGCFLEVFHNVAATVRGGHISVTGQVVMRHVNLIGGEQIAQVDHALLGVWCVAASREAAGELSELIVRVAGGARVALGHVQRNEAGNQAAVLVKRSQAFEVVGVVNIGVLRVQADEAVSRGLGCFRLNVLVVGVDQLQLRLLGITAERVARLQCLELGDGAGVAIIIQVGLCLLVEFGLAQVFVDHLFR